MPGRQGQRPEYQEAGPGCWMVRGCRGALSAQGTSVLKQPRLCLSLSMPARSNGLLGQLSTGKGTEESEEKKKKEEGVSLIDDILASFYYSPIIYAARDFYLQRSQH